MKNSIKKSFIFRNKNRVAAVRVEAAKKNIPKALRSAVWETYVGKVYETKCKVEWCKNTINPFIYEVGHNIPESKGGSTTIDNLRPICSQCNKSMGNHYTIDEFNDLYKEPPLKNKKRCFCFKCFGCYTPTT